VARGLRKITIAECVEDRQTLEMLTSFGVDAVQGFFLERPHAGHRPAEPAVKGVSGELKFS